MVEVEVEVRGVGAAAGDDAPLLVLQERHDPHRCLPIWIGGAEALALTAASPASEMPAPPRLLTHRLLLDVLESLGAQLTQVRITAITAGQFHAELDLTPTAPRATGTAAVVSARASDAVTLALQHRCPILVTETVLAQAGLPAARLATPTNSPTPDMPAADLPATKGPAAEEPAPSAIEDQVEQLRQALTEATPDDFRPGPDEQPPEHPN